MVVLVELEVVVSSNNIVRLPSIPVLTLIAIRSSSFSCGRQQFHYLKVDETKKMLHVCLLMQFIYSQVMQVFRFQSPCVDRLFPCIVWMLSTTTICGILLVTNLWWISTTKQWIKPFRTVNFHWSVLLDGSTNLHGKGIKNMMLVCVPRSYFLEHFAMHRRWESATATSKYLTVTCGSWF